MSHKWKETSVWVGRSFFGSFELFSYVMLHFISCPESSIVLHQRQSKEQSNFLKTFQQEFFFQQVRETCMTDIHNGKKIRREFRLLHLFSQRRNIFFIRYSKVHLQLQFCFKNFYTLV